METLSTVRSESKPQITVMFSRCGGRIPFEVDLGVSIPTREQVYLDLVVAIRAITTLAAGVPHNATPLCPIFPDCIE